MVSKIERGEPSGYNVLVLWDLTRMLGVPWIELADNAVRDLHRRSRVYPPRPPAAGGDRTPGLLL